MEVTYQYSKDDYRIIPVRIVNKPGVLETAYSVQVNVYVFGYDIGWWKTKATYTDVKDAKAHIKHTTGADI